VHYEVTAYKCEKKVTELMFENDSRLDARNRREFESQGFVITRPVRGDDAIRRCVCDVKIKRSNE
jgi:hypothetical protein